MAEIFTGEGGGTTGIINDSSPSLSKTYSSNKIEALVTSKASKSNGVENEILLRDANGNPKTSGKKIGDFSESDHTHNANEVVLSTTNFGNVLDNANINTLQKLADFIDDNIGFGRSLEFNWNGTQLGIKQEGDPSFQYVDLKGDTGRGLEFAWTGTQLGVRLEGSVGAYSYVDLEGPRGEDGDDGDDGLDVEFLWSGTQLGVRQEGQPSYTFRELKGETGNGISTVVRTSGTGAPGTTDTYTITFTDTTTSTFDVVNGANGEGAMQTVSTANGSLIQINSTDPANPVFSLADITESDITDLDKYTQQEVDDAITALQTLLRDGVATEGDTLKKLLTKIEGIQTLLASDNVNLDSVQELVDAIEDVQSSLSNILVNDLTTGGTTKALTAEMGKTLKGLIDALTTVVAGKEPVFTKNTGFNKAFGTTAGSVSEGNHNHSGVYEPVFTKKTGFNKDFGTASGSVSEGNHNHNTLYPTITQLNTNDRSYITDTRGANRPPSYYDDRYAQWDFVASTDIGLTEVSGWCAILTVGKWTDYQSTHPQEQLIVCQGRWFTRVATSESAWGPIVELVSSGKTQKLEIGQRASNSTSGRGLLVEKISTSSGETSTRILLPEHNSTDAGADKYGVSLVHSGDTNPVFPSGATPGLGNAYWAIMRHDNNINGVPVIKGFRGSNDLLFSGSLSVNTGTQNPTGNLANGKSIAIGDSDTGLRQNGDGILEAYANNLKVATFSYGGGLLSEFAQGTNANAVVRKDYLDTQIASAGGFPKVIWTSTPQSTATFTYYTFTHGKGLVSSDVTSGRYGIMITYTVGGYGRTILGGATHYGSDGMYGNTQWTSGNPSGESYVAFQANTLKIYSGNSGYLGATTNMRVHLIQRW